MHSLDLTAGRIYAKLLSSNEGGSMKAVTRFLFEFVPIPRVLVWVTSVCTGYLIGQAISG